VELTDRFGPFSPWQFPEERIPVVVHKVIAGEPIPLDDVGTNLRGWQVVDDHVNALLLPVTQGQPGVAPHDRLHAIDPTHGSRALGRQPRLDGEEELVASVVWYLATMEWRAQVRQRAVYGEERSDDAN
jgi:dTDP-D-glucose 4,6-dehydratase